MTIAELNKLLGERELKKNEKMYLLMNPKTLEVVGKISQQDLIRLAGGLSNAKRMTEFDGFLLAEE